MPELLLLQPDSRFLAVIRQALGPEFRLTLPVGWRELDRVAARGTVVGCLVDIFGAQPQISIPALRRFRRKHPTLALVICSDFGRKEIELYHLGRANVHGVIRMEESPSVRTIRRVMREALASALAETVLVKAGAEVPPLGLEVIRWAIEHAASQPQVSDLAAALALTPRAMHREMRRMELAPPRTLLLWGRLLHAAYSLERLGETVEGIALGLGYSTAGALRKALKRHVGCSPTALLRRGGLERTLEEFRLKGLRRAQRGRKRWANSGSHRWRTSPYARRPS